MVKMPLYDRIGLGYARSRPADPRITTALRDALGLAPPSTILDVGAGTGKYARALAEYGFTVFAIEPSSVMRAQCESHPAVHSIAAAAEDIPLEAGVAQGAFIVLALHHFRDRRRALSEILRIIGPGPLVIFSFEPRALVRFWLSDYFPRLGREVPSSFSELEDIADEVMRCTGRRIQTIPFALPRDLEDKFAAAGWARPEMYLDPNVRSGISSFSLMPVEEVEQGVQRLSGDLDSGAWDRRFGALRTADRLDLGYRFIVALELR